VNPPVFSDDFWPSVERRSQEAREAARAETGELERRLVAEDEKVEAPEQSLPDLVAAVASGDDALLADASLAPLDVVQAYETQFGIPGGGKGWLDDTRLHALRDQRRRIEELGEHETVLIPPHFFTSIQIHQLRELRLYAYLPEQGFRPLGRLYSVAETLGLSSKQQAWRLRIQDFFIEKELRGRGIGSQMLTLFLRMAEAEGCEYVSGELSSQDAIDGSVAHLVRFCERHGFKISPVLRPGAILATIRLDILKPTTSAVTKFRMWRGLPLLWPWKRRLRVSQ